MSLKALKKKIEAKKTSQGGTDTNSAPSSGYPAFKGLDYNLAYKQLSRAELIHLLDPLLNRLKTPENGQKSDAHQTDEIDINDNFKKELLLVFFQLAFSQESRAVGCFHPSEISTEPTICRRKMYYQYAQVPKDKTFIPFTNDNRMMRLVDLGTMLHLYVQANLHRLGVLVDMETPIHAPEIGISGKADGIVHFAGADDLGKFYDEEMILEVKSINDYGFKALRRAKAEHLKQASIYGGVLKFKRIVFLYINKNTSEHKIFVEDIDYNYFDGFCDEATSVIKEYQINKRKSRSSDIEKHDVPNGVCNLITSKRATECAYRDTCFKN